MKNEIFLTGFISYVVLMVVISAILSRRQKSGVEFLLGGRSFPLFLTLGSTVATMVGTGSSIGAVGFAYKNGWAGVLYGLGGAVGILLLAWMFAPIRKFQFMTMSEELSYYVGANRIVKNVSAVLMLIASLGWLGSHILGGGLYLAWIAHIDLTLAKVLIAAGFAAYVVIGGYTAMVWTDTLQAIVLFIGFVLIAFFSVTLAGGLGHIQAQMDPAAVTFLALDKIGPLHALSLSVVVAVGVLATPSYRQRIYAGRDAGTVRRSFLISGVLYLFFSLLPAVIGMAAHALDPKLPNADFAFPFLASQVLPVWLGLIVLTAGMSSTLSTSSADSVAAVSILLVDIRSMLTRRQPDPRKAVAHSRIALVAVIGVALLLALPSSDIISYITKMIATVLSGLFACGVLGRFWPRFTWQGALATLVSASGTSLAVMAVPSWSSFWGNPCIPSVVAAFAAGVVVSLVTPPVRVTSEEALALLAQERKQMEGAQLVH
ncbi:sodium:solute symporter family protein [Paraburkholderia caballeronis]|uniref:Solute:Na+ symporter, SSS family n=1 Tax=Paraburkholderia caballeronis TaxID=416943 RepID=A0A1H7RL39_9BURK|nr:sodium:solute symporter family protein [Paraburkholderia caballeronis]PXW23088.1 SSS family solute:Na+ symporter [Paraburkholderia caballeronis]PXW97752.1 SSS family solute:Na+ symporter [Paraburkholderia caballeronis]RAJ94722.1 SSS family solute:Na+ symporter [Paraburkholderia caballeronis]TDV11749.1 SSS family solute:Na+ symporter [Paraburkholderia caballeronis]TDV14830.1 SSS family solute:Na+ symporter [Paraburkholderia caballeronis]